MGTCCSKKKDVPPCGNTAQEEHPREEDEPQRNEEMVVSSNTFGNSPTRQTTSEVVGSATEQAGIQTIPYIDDDRNAEDEEDVEVEDVNLQEPQSANTINATAEDGGIIQLGADSSVTFEGDHKFPQGSQSQITTQVEQTSSGLNLKSKGHGGPGIIQLGKGSTVQYISDISKTPTQPKSEFKGFATKSGGELKKITDNTQTIEYMETVSEFGRSVGIIWIGINQGTTGTGFRVGERYIMTAYHIVKQYLEGYQTFNANATFFNNPNAYIDFSNTLNRDENPSRRYTFLRDLYREVELDVIVLELNLEGRTPPLQVTFCDVNKEHQFTFVGHDKGEDKQCDPACVVVEPSSDEIKKGTKFCIQNKFPSNGYEGLEDPKFVRFHCRFEKGASGSPGVMCIGREARVCIMLLRGYPYFYWDLPSHKQKLFKDEYMLEEGVSMESVMHSMKENNEDACRKVFPQVM